MTTPAEDYDSPWKEALERYFEPFLAFFFPRAHADINWTRDYEFLDKELQQVVRDADFGRRLVDKLARVWRKGGQEVWVLIHVEVQGQVELDFPRRMYTYNYRIFDRYGRHVASFAVLGDTQRDWRPDSFGYDLWGCQPGIRFPVVKLLDYEAQWESLEQDPNPFAMLVMAHLKTQATHGEPATRLEWKLGLIRALYERGYAREDVLELFRVIDWMMALPEDLAVRFDDAVEQLEMEKEMPYVTHIERRGIARGLREAVLETLSTRFEHVPDDFPRAVDVIFEADVLRALLKQALVVESLDQFREALAQSRPS